MPNITLTQEQLEIVIYNLAFAYTSFGDPLSINTANDIAVETSNEKYFNGIVKGLSIIYPIPPESPDIPEI